MYEAVLLFCTVKTIIVMPSFVCFVCYSVIEDYHIIEIIVNILTVIFYILEEIINALK